MRLLEQLLWKLIVARIKNYGCNIDNENSTNGNKGLNTFDNGC